MINKKKLSRSEYLKKKQINAESAARINQTYSDYGALIKEKQEKNEAKRIARIEAEEQRKYEREQRKENEILKKLTPEEKEIYFKNKKKFMENYAKTLGKLAGMGLFNNKYK